MPKYTLIFILMWSLLTKDLHAAKLLIPMDQTQKEHLKSYGITYWALAKGKEGEWLLNYRGGSFMFELEKDIEKECLI